MRFSKTFLTANFVYVGNVDLVILFWGLVWNATNSTTFGNTTLTVSKIWVARKVNRGVGAQEGGPPGRSTDQVVPGVSHPGINVLHLPTGVSPISHSPEGLKEPGGEAPPGGYRSGGTRGSHLGIGYFSRPVSSGLEPYCGVKSPPRIVELTL